MSRSTFVRCQTGNNAFADCEVSRRGDLLRLVGYTQMDFTREDARRLIAQIQMLLEGPDRETRPPAPIPATTNGSSGDAIVDETIALLLARSKRGQEKYGTTLMRTDLDLLDWMQHAIEESLDLTLYMVRAVEDLKGLLDDGR